MDFETKHEGDTLIAKHLGVSFTDLLSNWDSLIYVMDSLEEDKRTDTFFTLEYRTCTVEELDTDFTYTHKSGDKKECVYMCIVEWIKWHNQQED